MLQEEQDPLNTSIFDINTSNSVLGNTLSSTMFSTQFEEDPWISHTTAIQTSNPSRSFTAPNFYTSTSEEPTNATTVLSGLRLPSIYEQLFSQNQRSGRISLSNLNNILSKAKVTANQIETIMQIVVPNGASYVTQSEFNTAIALIACAQNKIDVSLDGLENNKNYLPEPFFTLEEPLVNQQEPTTKQNYSSKTGYPGMTSPSSSVTSSTTYNKDEHTIKSNMLDTSHWFQNVEHVTVTVAPEREGFIFKHVNYIVTNEKRSSIVLRRYSDFWWLLQVLIKRYPFRVLPNLPPKKLGSRDDAFLEKRRKGLSRFINAIIRHPVLRQDDIVARFLTEPSELAAWRKQNPPHLDEEFKHKAYPIRDLENMTPLNLEEQLQNARKRITAATSHYINLGFIMERMIRRMHGQAADFSRYSIALNSLAESELRYHAGECINCQQVVRGCETVARHMQTESNLLEEQMEKATDGTLEDLKIFRDLLVSFRELDERRAKLSVNQMDVLSKRIAANRTKVHQNKGVPGLEAEVAKLEEAIRVDELELSNQQDRQVFIRFCMWSELIYLHKQQAFVSTLYQNLVKESIHYSKLRATNWQDLEEPTLNMPGDVDLFE